MHFLWKSGFKVYVTMVVVLMDKINLSFTNLCRWVRALFIFEIAKALPAFFIYMTWKNPLSTLKFLG